MRCFEEDTGGFQEDFGGSFTGTVVCLEDLGSLGEVLGSLGEFERLLRGSKDSRRALGWFWGLSRGFGGLSGRFLCLSESFEVSQAVLGSLGGGGWELSGDLGGSWGGPSALRGDLGTLSGVLGSLEDSGVSQKDFRVMEGIWGLSMGCWGPRGFRGLLGSGEAQFSPGVS